MPIKVGDRVIHPRHGLGQVTRLSVKQFVEGEKRPFYEISFPGSTLWVPLDLTTSGIRKLSAKSEIASCRRVLKSLAEPLSDDYRLRQTELKDHLKEGTLTARCEVVRDLTAFGWHKPLSGSIAVFLQTTLDVLCQEWAAVEKITAEEAAIEIQTLLEKGTGANDNS
ncbi:MAG: CarD family transcriptional regulator [Anaerolineales bacterium]|jgi:RNA polymerase-interacting CarD/CdnL/TRCF family regulator